MDWLGNDMPNSDWLDLVQLAMSSDYAELKDSLLRLPAPTYVYATVNGASANTTIAN